MTAKRDLKQRVRARQAETGESYVTALRRILAQRTDKVPVVELTDVSHEAAAHGLVCRTVMSPDLAGRIAPARVLAHLKDALRTTYDDPSLDLFRRVLLFGQSPRVEVSHQVAREGRAFVARALAGIGGVSANGSMLACVIDGEMILVLLSLTANFVPVARPPLAMVVSLDEMPLVSVFGMYLVP